MFKNILLPVYNSHATEKIIPYALALAEKNEAIITLITIIENSATAEAQTSAENYLRAVAESLYKKTDGQYKVDWLIGRGELEKEIARYAEDKQCDLVCLASSVKKGLLQHITGSHSERIIRAVNTLVLVVNSAEERRWDQVFSHLLIPIDNSDDSKKAINLSKDMAQKLGLRVTLFTMVYHINNTNNTDIVGLSATTDDFINKENFQEASSHLKKIAAEMSDIGISVTSKTVIGDDSTTEIAQALDESKADLTIMTTRASSPISAFLMGSNVRKIIDMNCLPILMVKQK